MYDITYQGRTLRLSNRDYKQLEMRFDPTRYRRSRNKEDFHNRSVCICSSYHGCWECPLSHEQTTVHCPELLRIISGYAVQEVAASRYMVHVYADNLDGIKRVHDVLLTATKVNTH